MSSRNVRNSDEHWTWRGRQGDFNSWECVFVSRWQIYTSAPAAFHLFNSLGGGYAAACQSTLCPACYLPECPSSKTHISAPLYKRSHSSNSIHSICTKALHQVGSPTTMAEGTVFCCFFKKCFFYRVWQAAVLWQDCCVIGFWHRDRDRNLPQVARLYSCLGEGFYCVHAALLSLEWDQEKRFLARGSLPGRWTV